jgi:hypothetical protein
VRMEKNVKRGMMLVRMYRLLSATQRTTFRNMWDSLSSAPTP